MRALFLLLFCGTVFSGCSRAPVIPPNADATPPVENASSRIHDFRHKASGLQCASPKGWSFSESARNVDAECRPSGSKADLPVIILQISAVTTDLTMPAIVAGYTRQIAKAVDNPVIGKDQPVDLGILGAEAYEISYTGKLGRQAVTGYPLIVRKGKWLLIVTRISEKANFEKNKPAFDEFSGSIKW